MTHFWTSSLKKVQEMCLQVKSVGIRLLHTPVSKLFWIFPIKKHQGNTVLNDHISLFNTASPQFPNGLGCAFTMCCCGSSFLAKYFHANNFMSQGSAYYYRHFSQKTPISFQLINVTLEETNNSMCSLAL